MKIRLSFNLILISILTLCFVGILKAKTPSLRIQVSSDSPQNIDIARNANDTVFLKLDFIVEGEGAVQVNQVDVVVQGLFDDRDFDDLTIRDEENKSISSIKDNFQPGDVFSFPIDLYITSESKRTISITADVEGTATPMSTIGFSLENVLHDVIEIGEKEVVANPFPDTDLNTLNGIAAKSLFERTIINGYPDGEFKGDRLVTRAEAAKMLFLAKEVHLMNGHFKNIFPDVIEGEWYVPYVLFAYEIGIINGYPDGLFRPAENINTAEFLKMFVKTFELSENMEYSFEDVPAESWFAQFAGVAEKYNLFPEREQNLFPARKMTRYEFVVALYQYGGGEE